MKKSIKIFGAFLLSAVLVGGLYVFDIPQKLNTSVISYPGGRFRGSRRSPVVSPSNTLQNQNRKTKKMKTAQPLYRGSNRRTPSVKAWQLRHQENVIQQSEGAVPVLKNPTKKDNVLYQKNRNGKKVFYGYRAGELAPEKLLKIAYARRQKNYLERGPKPSRNTRKVNYNILARRAQVKTSAPKISPKRRITIRTPKPKDTMVSRRNVGVNHLKNHETKYRTTRYSLRHSERLSGGAAATFRRAKEQLAERNMHEAKVWAHNRKPDPTVKKSRIQIKNPKKCAYPPCENKDAGGDILTLES